MTRVLLRFPHGLGDCIQFSVVLAHLKKYRPDWEISLIVGRGKHTALLGQCSRVYHDQEKEPEGPYDATVDIGFYENYCKYTDRVNSKVSNCLAECFGLKWDGSLGRYSCATSPEAMHRAAAYLRTTGATSGEGNRFNVVVIHYVGNTSAGKKNLGHWQAEALVETVIAAGRIPVILDFDDRTPLVDQKRVFCPGVGPKDIWGGFGSGDAATIRALIDQAEAFVGIDSGPGKVASATDTPTLICWRGHHPIQFHDPACNTLHLVPASHRSMPPCADAPGVAEFFERHYQFTTYENGEHGLVASACRWIRKTLNVPETVKEKPVTFVLPNGIGDVMWALLKIRSIASGRPIDVILSGDPRREIDRRAVPFLKRFGFVESVRVLDVPIHPDKDHPTNSRGRYVYVSDGQQGDYHFLIPNGVLEDGRRIETWLPEFPTDYDVVKLFDWSDTERGRDVGRGLAPFVAFYLGPEQGHTNEGHNRGWLWEPKHWIELGKAMAERGMTVAVVGADYDRSFWERYVADGVRAAGLHWIDLIGRLEIGETFALLRESKCLVSYQCGLAIGHHYFGGRAVSWWRPDGDSGHPERLLCFSDQMKDAWIRPGWEGNYLGCLYRRETVSDIVATIDERGWLK